MEVIFQIMAGMAIFSGGQIFMQGWDKRPRLDGHNEVYQRRLKRNMATGIAIAVCGFAYFIIF